MVLMVFAGMSAMAVLGDLGVLDASAAEENVYALRDYGGHVAVFCPAEAQEPILVTDISVETLPAGDRRDLQNGLGAGDYEEMIAILEGLSS